MNRPKRFRLRSLPRLVFDFVVAAVCYVGTTAPALLARDLLLRARWLDRAASASWPVEEGDYPETLRLLSLARRPRLALALACHLLAAYRDGEFISGYSGSCSFGEQSPSQYKRHRSAFMRWLRFLRECVFPTVFVKRCDWAEVHGYAVDGYEIGVYFWLEGRSRQFGAGRRGAFLYPVPFESERDDEPPYEEPPLETCPSCRGSGLEGTLDGEPVLVTMEMVKGEGFEGLEYWDCRTCGGSGEVEPEDALAAEYD